MLNMELLVLRNGRYGDAKRVRDFWDTLYLIEFVMVVNI
jgi:hypothetical protein